ncbi:MAG TPA: AMP-binding protein [Pseudonocardia sp.]|jgi:acyl-CoA synthetase (AMP-forming)/AMP-acid ligase II
MINLAELGTKMAHCAPEAPALIDSPRGISRSFGALSTRVTHLAEHIVAQYGGGQRVAVLSRNCVEMMELYLACAASGSLLFPLNWRFSAAQVKEALLDADPAVVFYADEFAPIVAELRTVIEVRAWVCWTPGADSEFEELMRAPTASVALPDPSTLLHQPFLAVSTGGTTGIPKSAVHSQYSYAACALNYLAAARIAQTDVYLMLGQLFHVVGYMPLAYLAMGRPVVIANFDEGQLVEVIRQERVSGFFAIATMLPRLVRAVRDSPGGHSLRQVEYGGAPMGQEVIREAGEVFGADLIQAWGMSELGPGTYLGPADHRRAFAGDHPERLRSCGRGALLSTVAVLDEQGRPVPKDGATMGEICHRGPGNMIGYWHKPAETADLMRDGWVHSGDGGTWDSEGYIYIVDRMKSMIISGGENIFPGEIERVLGNHPRIAEVVVVGAADPEWGEVVKAVVVRRPGAPLTAAEVTGYVESELGSYKKPRIVEFVAQLPVTPTGKIDRRALSTTGS